MAKRYGRREIRVREAGDSNPPVPSHNITRVDKVLYFQFQQSRSPPSCSILWIFSATLCNRFASTITFLQIVSG